MEKMIWSKPEMNEVAFAANEYVAGCGTLYKTIWKFICNAWDRADNKMDLYTEEGYRNLTPGDYVYYSACIDGYDTNGNPKFETIEITQDGTADMSIFQKGYVDKDHLDGQVEYGKWNSHTDIIWSKTWIWQDENNNYHASRTAPKSKSYCEKNFS